MVVRRTIVAFIAYQLIDLASAAQRPHVDAGGQQLEKPHRKKGAKAGKLKPDSDAFPTAVPLDSKATAYLPAADVTAEEKKEAAFSRAAEQEAAEEFAAQEPATSTEPVDPPIDQMPEFQCASEYNVSSYGCKGKDCNMNKTCTCDGIVKFGYGKKWTNYTNVTTGSIECEAASFPESDPWPDHGKVCMCRPKVYMCATEWSKPWANCTQCGSYKTTCPCSGHARIGYSNSTVSAWSEWQEVNDSISCSVKGFGGTDPNPGQGKVCQCQPADLFAGGPAYGAEYQGSFGGVLRSIVIITVTYFIVYMMLAYVRSRNQMKSLNGPSALEKILETAATNCVYFAPMLCALFFAVSKRADTLTNGSPYMYHLPAKWLQGAVGTCSVCFLLQTLCFVIAEYAGLQHSSSTELVARSRHQNRAVACWRIMTNLFTFVMYVCVAIIILGVLFMEEPQKVVKEVGRTPVRAGTVITLVLAVVYFGVYLLLHVFRNQEMSAGEGSGSFGFEVMKLAATAMNFAPMMCLLFLGTQIAGDWSGIMMPPNVSQWMYVCMYSVLLQVVLVIAAPWLANAELQVVGNRGEVDFVTRNHEIFVAISIIRWIAMFILYVGIVIIITTLWEFEATPALTHELFRFSLLYFAAYLVLWAAITARQFSGGGYVRAIRVLSVAKDAVVFCPMLSALYLSSFVRAHSFINKYATQGEPQAYVQDWMVVSFYALVAMLVMVVLAGFSTPKAGADSEKPASPFVYIIGYHIAMTVLFVSVLIVVGGLFTINTDNADADGARLTY